tara:strand:+ start:791 stop:1456 length:666 start_codon:yes stop_codon:yes gene_type:complete
MISIVIPVYEMAGVADKMLLDLLYSIQKQTYKDYEIIVSDESPDRSLQDLCFGFENLKYYVNNGSKGACYNLNNALIHAKGSIIKPMFQDDQFYDIDCLQKFSNISSPWAVCTSEHLGGRNPHVPYFNADVYELARGCNTFGSPSAVGWKANDFTFDENLKWLFDCDFYARMMIQYGQPQILDTKVLIREWDGMATRTVATGSVRVTELEYIESKFSNLRL